MIATTISAVSYADIALFVILGIGLLGGLIGGLARAFKGFFKTIAIILISLLIVGATVVPICNTSLVKGWTSDLAGKTAAWGDVYTEPIFIADDGSYYIYTEYDGEPNKVQLEAAGGNNLVGTVNGKLAAWLAKRFITESGTQTLGGVGASALMTLLTAVCLFVIYCIALGIICWLLRKAFKNMHSSDNTAVRVIDRTLGAVLSAGLALIFIMLVLAILHTLGSKIPTMHEYLINSPVCGFLYEHNPISIMFAKIFG
ncbi:MAG: CvpA family protein [Clostridia bacterium]|nr:CvpA family protein [Clostridia bacterium]